MEVKKEESTASFSQHGGVGESAGYEEEEKKGQGGVGWLKSQMKYQTQAE